MKKSHIKESRPNRTLGERALHIIVFTIFLIECLILLFPLLYLFMTSLKTQREFSLNSPFALPESFGIINYKEAFTALEVNETNLFGMLFNSLWFSLGMVTGNMLVCAMFAYIIARYPFKGSRAIYAAVLAMMSIPIMGSGPAAYRLYSKLHLINNPLYVIMNWGGMGYNFIFLEKYFRYVAKDYGEAARIDGAGHYRTFFSIMFPQLFSVLSALFIMQFVEYWNLYDAQLLYLKELPNLSVGLYLYQQKMVRVSNIPVFFAGLVISFIPITILFIIFQNTIMERISGGGLKG